MLKTLIALLSLVAVTAWAGWSILHPPAGTAWRLPTCVSLLLAIELWLFFDGTMEGPTLVSLNNDNGLTVSDLLVVPGLGLLALLAQAGLKGKPASSSRG